MLRPSFRGFGRTGARRSGTGPDWDCRSPARAQTPSRPRPRCRRMGRSHPRSTAPGSSSSPPWSSSRSEEHTSELQSLRHLVCRLLLEKKKNKYNLHERTRHDLGKLHQRREPESNEHELQMLPIKKLCYSQSNELIAVLRLCRADHTMH